MTSLLFVGARQAVPWFVGFGALVAFSGAIDPTLAASAPHIPSGVVVAFFVLNILGVSTTAYVLLQYFVRARERARAELEVSGPSPRAYCSMSCRRRSRPVSGNHTR